MAPSPMKNVDATPQVKPLGGEVQCAASGVAKGAKYIGKMKDGGDF
jgi:hypothetical protein